MWGETWDIIFFIYDSYLDSEYQLLHTCVILNGPNFSPSNLRWFTYLRIYA